MKSAKIREIVLGKALDPLKSETRHSLALVAFIAWVGLGADGLSSSAYGPEERDRAQGALNLFVFATMAVSSFSSGVLVTTQGWRLLNYGSLLPVALTGVSLVWLALKLRNARPATA